MEPDKTHHRRGRVHQRPSHPGIVDVAGENVRLNAWERGRAYIYGLLLTPEIDTKNERFVRQFIAVLIVLNVAAVVIGSVPAVHDSYYDELHWFEVASVAVFSVEYLLRLWAIVLNPKYAHPVWGRLRYSVSFFAMVDLIAILPFFLPHIIEIDLISLRALRLLRIARVLKLGRYSEPFSLFRRVFAEKREELTVSLFVGVIVLLVSSSIMYFIEREAQPEAFPHIPAALWWGVATLTTIGYGDVYPVTAIGKICAGMVAIVGIALIALPSSILVSGFIEQLQHRRGGHLCPHCGRSLDDVPSRRATRPHEDEPPD